MESSADTITRFLRRCRRRLVGMEAAAGALVAASAALGAVLAAVLGWLVAREQDWARMVLLGALVAGWLWTAIVYGLLPRWRWQGFSRIAREMEPRLAGRLGDLELVSAVQLRAQLPDLRTRPATSPDLVEAHLDQVAARLSGTDPVRLVAGRRLHRPIRLLAGLAVILVATALAFPDTLSGAVSWLVTPPAEAEGETAVAMESWVGDIRLTYRYPDYTGRQERVVEGTNGTVLALPGTRVAIASRADRAVAQASLKLDEGKIPLRVEGERHLAGELVVMKPGSYRFDLTDTEGRTWLERQAHPIHLETDKSPQVTLKKPDRDLVVREQDRIDLLYDVRDDFGIQEVRLTWRVQGRAGEVRSKKLDRSAKTAPRVHRQTFRWDLAPLRLQPGDRIQFTIEADDNDSILGPKTGRSATRTLKVFSAEEHHQELVRQAQALWEKMLGLLAGTLEQEPEARPEPRASAAGPYRRLHEETDLFLKASRELVEAFRKDPLASPSLLQALVNINRGLQGLQWELTHLLQTAEREREAERFANLVPDHRRRRIGSLERDVLYLEDLLDLLRLEDLDRIAKDLAAARERLTDLMQRYAQAPSDEVRRQIEAEIARLKEKIAQLMARQREVLKEIRDEYLNPEALSKMLSDRDMLAALDRIQKLMMEGKIDQALEELKQLQQQLDSLQAAIDQSRARFGESRYSQLSHELAKIMSELNTVTETQRQLLDSTEKLREQVIRKLNQLDKSKLAALFGRLRKRLERAVAEIAKIPRQTTDRYLDRSLAESLERAKILDAALKSEAVAAALESSERLLESTSRLESILDNLVRFEGRFDPRKKKELVPLHRASSTAHGEVEAIHKELKKLLPRPEQLLGRQDLKRLDRLAGRQAELKSRLQSLRAQMQKVNESAPLFGREAMGGLERGGLQMGHAARQLGKRLPRGARPHQQEALSELERLQQSIQNACKQGGAGMPLPMGGAGVAGMGDRDWGEGGGQPSRRDVEIPGPDDYQPPEAFRKALLDGMKDPVPEDFRHQVRRYYEELVR